LKLSAHNHPARPPKAGEMTRRWRQRSAAVISSDATSLRSRRYAVAKRGQAFLSSHSLAKKS
jgi:hypothetical protein